METIKVQAFVKAMDRHGDKTAAATVTLAIAIEKLALAQTQVAQAKQQQADSVSDFVIAYRLRR